MTSTRGLAALDDHALVEAARSGNRDALDSLLRRHHDRMYGVCRRITGNHADACDATQNAMIAMVRGLTNFDGRASVATWAYRIATNASLDELRRRHRRPVLAPGDHDEHSNRPQLDGPDPHSSDATDAIGERDAIEAALLAIPEEFRVPIVLRDIADLDYAEIAAVLDIPLGTVKSRIARGRGQLAVLLGGNQSDSTDRQSDDS